MLKAYAGTAKGKKATETVGRGLRPAQRANTTARNATRRRAATVAARG